MELRAYRVHDRVLVHYYDSGFRSMVICPDCGWSAEPLADGVAGGCREVDCDQCGMSLGMISSPVPLSYQERIF